MIESSIPIKDAYAAVAAVVDLVSAESRITVRFDPTGGKEQKLVAVRVRLAARLVKHEQHP